jgi:threonine/homoserine/homoserine lactone efflux protein
VRSISEFLVVALIVTMTPGPATATVIRVAARDGRRGALGAVAGNSCGVLLWGALSAVGVSSLILASEVAYDVLRIAGAAVLVVLGLRSLLHRGDRADDAGAADAPERARTLRGWRLGLVTGLANPKLAVFFVALFPQFLSPHAAVLPAALAMAGVIVALDVIWFSTLIWLVDRAGALLRPRLQRRLERITGGVLIGLGARLAAESR